MSAETMEWLNTMTRIGYTDTRGTAWHYRQGATNHYPGSIPLDVVENLLNVSVESRPIYVMVDGEPQEIDGRQAMVCTDNHDVLGIFKEGYRGHNYREWLIDGPASIVDTSKGELGFGSAGLLRNRAVAWVQLETPETVSTAEGVSFRPSMLATTSYDGTVASTYAETVTVVVCDNTLSMALGENRGKYRVKHTKNSRIVLNDAREALGIVAGIADDFTALVAEWCATEVSPKVWTKVLDALAPMPAEGAKANAVTLAEKKRDTLAALYANDPRVAPWSGTAFGVVQAFNTYTLHESRVNGEKPRAIRNMEAILSGKVADSDQATLRALEVALA